MLPGVFSNADLAFFLLILGLLGLYWELHAPGLLVPGLAGVVLMIAGITALSHDSPTWYGAALLTFACLLLTIELKYYTHMIAGFTGTLLLAGGAILLVQGPHRISPAFAIAVSAAFGAIVTFLGVLAMRSRTSRLLMGLDALIGQSGLVETPLDPSGTVRVRGEYWQATSSHPIPAGHRVSVERVQNLTLFVKEI